jgi:hypothetical protein
MLRLRLDPAGAPVHLYNFMACVEKTFPYTFMQNAFKNMKIKITKQCGFYV